MKHLLYIFLVLATLLTGLYLLPKHTPLFEYYRLRPVFEVATIVFLIGVLCLYGREKRQVKMIFSRLSQKNFFLDLAIQCGGIYIWEFKDEEFFFEYPVGDQSLRIELEEMWRLIHPDDLTAFKLLWQSLWKADKEVFQCRARFAGSDYEWWEFRFSAMPAVDNAEGGKDVSGILININDMKKREKELSLMRGYEQKFLANMSHEIRTPLNAIVGFSTLLAQEKLDDVEKREYVEQVEGNNTYLLSLMENILNIADMDSRVWEMPREEIEVDACCKECIEGFRPELKPGVELEYVPASGIMAFYAARQWLKMVLVSLLDNAVKFTEEGHIRVSCEEDKSRHVLRFVIEDTGIGIRPDESDRIFERFYKVDTFTKGSGLGLAIANEIMELVGGRIYLDDTYCGGCRFIVEWPMKDKP